MAALQDLLDQSAATAGPAVAATFNGAEKRLSADDFRAFWRATRMFAVATAGANGAPHIAPVHVLLEDGDVFRMSIFENAVRLQDLPPRPAYRRHHLGPDGTVAILYGRTSEVPGSRREFTRGGIDRAVLIMEIEPTRIHVMRPTPRPASP